MIAKSQPIRPAKRPLFSYAAQQLTLVCALALLSACAGGPSDRPGRAKIAIPVEQVPAPIPAEPEQAIDFDAVERVRRVALNEGTLAAHGERNALLVRGLDATSAALIDSIIAWYEGDLQRADAQLRQINPIDNDTRQRVLAERRYRAAAQNDWLTAAALGHRQLISGNRDPALKDSIWAQLMHIDDAQLAAALRVADGEDWRGWLELARAYRSDRASVNTWLARHAGHSATAPLPAGLDAWLDTTTPERLAVLLPLSGRLQGAGEAVLAGITDALYLRYREPAQRPQLITLDSEEYPDAISAYRDAVRRGADAVLGPLTKNDAQVLGSLRERPVPILALNRPEALPVSDAEDWSALSLAPEDEARQIARLAFGNGLRRALIIRPDSDWGQRMDSALQQSWRGLGGHVVNSRVLSAEPTVSEQISRLVGGFESEARIRAMEQAFEAPVEARPRRRQDFDVIFLLAPSPAEARSLRPLLVYHFSGDVPVYAPSTVNSGNQHLQNRDLNSLISVEIPAVLSAVDINRYTRLQALGADALALIEHQPQLERTESPVLRASTGVLKRRANGEIERELIPVVFDGGAVRPLP